MRASCLKKISSVAEQDGMPPKLTVWYLFPREEELYSGDFVTVRIREAGDYDLMGDVVYGYEFGE